MQNIDGKSKIKVERFPGQGLILRWQLCQNIGKVFYHSDLSHDALIEYYHTFKGERGLPKTIPIIDIK